MCIVLSLLYIGKWVYTKYLVHAKLVNNNKNSNNKLIPCIPFFKISSIFLDSEQVNLLAPSPTGLFLEALGTVCRKAS